MMTIESKSRVIVQKIIENLSDRRIFDDLFDSLDEDIAIEIEDTLVGIVEKVEDEYDDTPTDPTEPIHGDP